MAPCYGWRSPHTRGARGQALRRLGPRRIIPAYAGSTGPPPAETQRRLHHPHIRGEHDVFADQVAQTKGSSPHTRGARLRPLKDFAPRPIIPAYAGSTCGRWRRACRWTDHPRIRGEHWDGSVGSWKFRGSSPHTRGARRCAQPAAVGEGIIPAYAGSTPKCGAQHTARADHPRIRGEHDFARSKTSRRDQSSPHTRGALPDSQRHDPKGEDHPRIRGEHADEPHWVGTLAGSSPHTRGAQRRQPGREAGARIIPAYAGSTRSEYSIIVPFRDHPRIRGEHFPVDVDGVGFRGSSPHTRGAPAEDRLGHLMCRIIPAYAGSTPARGQRHTTPGGSSPHTRGAHPSMKPSTLHPRIIPAYAGSTG